MSSRRPNENEYLEALDRLIDGITVDADGDGEKFWAFRQAFEDNVDLPADGFVIGEPVSVMEVDFEGNERRGLTARCRREDGAEYVVALTEVVVSQGSPGARHIAAYRKWLSLEPFPAEARVSPLSQRQHKANADDIDLSRPIELIVLSVKQRSARCRLLGRSRTLTLRASRSWKLAPGMVATVAPRKQWRYGGHPYLSGEILSFRIDTTALDLVPLVLNEMGLWDPEKEYWREEGGPVEPWAKAIIDRGPRPEFGMENVLPGENSVDPFSDPISRSNDLKNAGDREEAEEVLMELCRADLRCLDAHSHLGNLIFDHAPQNAINHYEIGLSIGGLSLDDDFNGVLPWTLMENRPFLRCLHGYGLCLWRLGRFEEAKRVFRRMLWLNPLDNQGASILLDEVGAEIAWENSEVS